MRTLNRAAAEALQALPAGAVHACTDVTGFGLIGHASEMAAASGVTVRCSMPAECRCSTACWRSPAPEPIWRDGVEPEAFRALACGSTAQSTADLDALLYDPQTSGGLLIVAAASAAGACAAPWTRRGALRRGRRRGRGARGRTGLVS